MSEQEPLWTAQRTASALAFCHEFEGTRHMTRRLIPGRGADCVRFVVGVLQAGGVLPEFAWPSYVDNRGFHQQTNWLAGAFLEHFFAESIAVEQWIPQTGDVGIFKVGNRSNHVGIFVDGRFWHVTTAFPVHHCGVATIRETLQEIIRITEPGLRKLPVHLKTT